MTSIPQISDLLRISPRFLRSVNLERDFGDSLALQGYVATQETARHLQRIGRSLRPESGERAWRITGDFGAGKSSFALLLANLLGRHSKELPSGVRKLRAELDLRANAPKLLPVLVTAAREPLAFAVLRGLNGALGRFVDGRKKLQCRTRLREILDQGSAEDREAVELIEATACELVSRKLLGGVLLIIDELGKSLEFAALNPEKQDVYFLQILSETSARSGEAPLYTLGLLHQGFAEYAAKLPSTARLEWNKVSERFSEISFSQPLGQAATLIAAALSVDVEDKALRGWKGQARREMAAAIDLGIFGPTAGRNHLTRLAPELYPLHPTVVPALARFFRRFGQNERSLFSFLLSSEPSALQAFAARDASPESVYRLADFFDFAANNFAHQLTNESLQSHWSHIDARVQGAEHEPEETQLILKTVGVLNVIQSPELVATRELLSLALGDPPGLSKSLAELLKRGILFDRGSKGYSLWPHASVNLHRRIQEAREQVTGTAPIADTARRKLDARPVVARRHYIETGNLRHFEISFLTAAEFRSAPEQLAPASPADGRIVVVLCESKAEKQQAEETAAEVEREDCLIAVSVPLDVLGPTALEIERWEWVARHTPELKDDPFAAEEVERQVAASRQHLESRLSEFAGFRGDGSPAAESGISWFHKGRPVSTIGQDVSLQSFLSDLCHERFSEAPRVRNELINRHSISSAAAAARQKLFKAMLESAEAPLLGLPEDKAPPEKSMYLSVLHAGKVHRDQDGVWGIAFPEQGEDSDPLNLRPALDAVVERLEQTPDERVSVEELFQLLGGHRYGIRDGLIPLLLLTVYLVHEAEIAIYEDGVFQPEVEEFFLQRFARIPKAFEFQLCRIAGFRKKLIKELAIAVEAESAPEEKLLPIVRPLCLFVANLPEYSRNTSKLSAKAIALRNAVENAREPVKLVFEAIPEALGFKVQAKSEPNAEEIGSKLSSALVELRRSFPDLQARMAATITKAFETNSTFSLWRADIAGQAEVVLMGLADQDLRAFCLKLSDEISPEGDWLEALGSLLVRRPPSRWRDRDEEVFCVQIHEFVGKFQRVLATCFDQNGTLPETALRLAITPRNGDERDVVLSLTSKESAVAADLKNSIRKILHNEKQISLAALSELVWDLLRKKQ